MLAERVAQETGWERAGVRASAVRSTMQGRLLYDRLACSKTFVRFTAAECAEGHCEGLGQVIFFARMFDWVDESPGMH